MHLVLMCLAFAATVLLVLSLYPSMSNKFTGQEEGKIADPAAVRIAQKPACTYAARIKDWWDWYDGAAFGVLFPQHGL